MTEIQERLFALRDEGYRAFMLGLLPGIDPDTVIGIRIPALRGLAKELYGTAQADDFLNLLPHRYYEENNLHAFLISLPRDFDITIAEVERLLPYVDNWATCDSLTPKAFAKDSVRLLPYIDRWIASDHPYTVRYGIGCLMRYFLDDSFDEAYLRKAATVRSDEYYVNMMIAWYFATALAKQYDTAVTYLEGGELPRWVHNKTIGKAIESYRVTDEHKRYLKTLRIK